MTCPSFLQVYTGGEVASDGLSVSGGTNLCAGANSADSVGNMAVLSHLDYSRVLSFCQEVCVPVDPYSNQPSGARMHKPMIITKLTDSSTPELYQALNRSETVNCLLECYRVAGQSSQELFYVVALGQCQIMKMETKQYDVLDPTKDQYMQIDELHVGFADIFYHHVIANKTSEDHFKTQGAAV